MATILIYNTQILPLKQLSTSRITICLSIHFTYKLITKCMHTPQMRTLYNHFLLCVIGNDTLAKRLNDNELHTLRRRARAYTNVFLTTFWCWFHGCVSSQCEVHIMDILHYNLFNHQFWNRIFLYNNIIYSRSMMVNYTWADASACICSTSSNWRAII